MRNSIKIISILIIILIISAVFLDYRAGHLESNTRGFAAFAKKELNAHALHENDERGRITTEYGEEFSLAVRKTHISCDSIAQYRDRKIQEIIDACDRDNVRALIIDSASFRSDNGAISFYITCREYVVKNRKLTFYHSEAETFMFDGKTGKAIDPLQALKKNYKRPASDFAAEYFKTTYSDKKLNGAYRQFIDNNDDNFNKFVVDGSEFFFIFDEGTVLRGSYGIISMMVPEMLMSGVQRKTILERYIDPSKPMLALTYDDGPGGEAEMQILDILYENSAVATFFYVGNRMSYAPECAVRAVQTGCEIGNHSWDHSQYSKMSDREVRHQIKRTNNAIEKCCGVTPEIGRPPYGDYKNSTIKAGQLPQVLWTVDTRDWATRNPESVFKTIREQDSLDGKIILMHSLYQETAKATELIVPWLKEEGYQTVTVSELIKYKTGKGPVKGHIYRYWK